MIRISRRCYPTLKGPMITEIKKGINGKVQKFELESWRVLPNHSAVARWVATEDNPFGLKAKSSSWGVWSMKQPHLTAYRIHDPEGELISYRFDVIDSLEIHQNEVSFLDLLLDFKIKDHYKPLEVLDEDELEDAISKNLLTKKQIKIVHDTKDFMQKDTNSILRRVDELITAALNIH